MVDTDHRLRNRMKRILAIWLVLALLLPMVCAAAEGMEYHRPLKSSRQLEKALSFIREIAPAVKGDDVFSTKIENLSMYLADFELDEL